MPQEIDRTLPEGAYVVSSLVYPTQGGPCSTRLFIIGRVNGDATVDRIQVTEDEARGIIEDLQRELAGGA